ncbi:MAG: hypothetical protein EDM03_00460 [Porphyrobacter sp. IPPAS B-1204]|nr:MAG: hypothetical protein EDM03_00460 [Porphyrobacter sp. IPPAS B-1204]
MSKTDKPLKAIRYRSYFWLMNFSAVVMSLFVLVILADFAIEEDLQKMLPGPLVVTIAVVSQIVGMIILPFLLCAKFMRDDYLDALWRRSIAVLAHATATIPLAIFAVTSIYYLGVGKLSEGPPLIRWVTNKVSVGSAMIDIWISYMILFVAIFQFLRWRDSR